MIETKLAEQPEQFQDEHGAWHVGRRVQIDAGDFAYDVSRTWCLPDGFRGTVEFDSVLFRLDHGSLVFVDPSRLSPCPASTTIVQRCGARMINSDGSPRSNIEEATK